MKNKWIILFFLIFSNLPLSAQENLSNLRNKTLVLNTDSIFLDTLSIVPSSVKISGAYAHALRDSLLIIDYPKALLIVLDKEKLYGKTIRLIYRVFPYNFSGTYRLRKNPLILPDELKQSKKITVQANASKKENFFDDELKKNGSISRGFMIGNQRDLSTVSNLNLQLSGKINDEVSVLAVISDNNLPIQPEGNTQQIQEFDNVFVQLFTKKSGIIVGDYLLLKPEGYFMNLHKKNRGVKLYSGFNFRRNYRLHSAFSAGLSKGKYNRIRFRGIEGNQGPYRLTGSENEQYIIVLSGSEKVYIDGELMKRGQNFDYTIDYNTAEITFTQNRLITKDKRITVEFEYALQIYPRTVFFQTNSLSNGKNSFWLNFYRHADNKNDPLSLLYNEKAQKFLSETGDSIQNAVFPNVDSTAYNPDLIMYERIDTMVNGIRYDTVYKQSYNPQKAVYRVGFSFVGTNKGNYRLVSSTANGKVYEWVAPLQNIPQGDYEPVVLLITPKTQLLSTAGGHFSAGNYGNIFIEGAISNYNLNTYSLKDKNDDLGYAGKFIYKQHLITADTNFLQLNFRLKYQFATQKFQPLDNYRSVEFERDWNIRRTDNKYQEQRAGFSLNFYRKNLGNASAGAEFLSAAQGYLGKKAYVFADLRSKSIEINGFTNYLQTTDNSNKSFFLRHQLKLSKHFKWFTLGVGEEAEKNTFYANNSDSLLLNSFCYKQYEVFLHQPDSVKQKFFANYKYRDNKLPFANSLQTSDKSNEYTAGLGLKILKNIRIGSRINYRQISYRDTLSNLYNEENALTGRGEMQIRSTKSSIVWSGFYETGFGFENLKNYQYIEVAPGQGQFTWIDYNGNNIKELNEFEYAKYQDQANYIRVVLASIETQKIFLSQLNQSFVLMPERVWAKALGIKKFIAHFSNRFALRILQKADHDDYIPDLTDNPGIISLNFELRNIFTFKTFNRKWQIDYIFNQNKQKVPLMSGAEYKNKQLNRLKIKYQFGKHFTFFNDALYRLSENISALSGSNNFLIKTAEVLPAIQYQPKINWFVNFSYRYSDKQNLQANEKAFIGELKGIYNRNLSSGGNLQANFSFINIRYNDDALSPVAYELLEGLLPGKNMVWELIFNKKLSKIFQLQLNYNGRLNENAQIIHNGGVQLRASF